MRKNYSRGLNIGYAPEDIVQGDKITMEELATLVAGLEFNQVGEPFLCVNKSYYVRVSQTVGNQQNITPLFFKTKELSEVGFEICKGGTEHA